MQRPTTRGLVLIPLFILFLLAGHGPFAQPPQDSADEATQERELSGEDAQARMDLIRAIRENVSLFGEIYRQVNMRYVDQVNPEAFMKAGIRGMLSTLDPYTDYIERESSDDLRILSEGEYGGVGLKIGTRGTDRVLTVISPIEGTPAWRLGLRAGDQILYIEDEPTDGFTTSDAAEKLRGPAGTKVRVKVKRYGVDELLEYTITRERIEVKDVSFAGIIEPGIGYVRLTRFSRSAGEEVREAVEDLAGRELDGIILDLRSNPGGLLPEAIDVAENFLAPGEEIVSTKGSLPRTNNNYYAQKEPSLPDSVPLVVLINGGSASASEIVSGAVQDLDRGVIIGSTSFGKGLVQNVINFNDGTALRVTTAKYYTPSGRLIQKTDYFHDNEAIVPTRAQIEEDTLYHTASGREVVAHGGIVPDLLVEHDEVGELTLALWRQDIYFDFISRYLDTHPDLSTWEGRDDELYRAFQAHVDTIDFQFETELQRRLAALDTAAKTSPDSAQFAEHIDPMRRLAAQQHDKLFEQERDEIANRLVVELAAALAGSAGRVRASVGLDEDIRKAVEVLNTEGMYTSVLAGGYADARKETEDAADPH
ncbi:MAG: Carboxy-terminal processing protease CtpB [Calditrichaeota bacterium]|nr:Carboxy-terminal processing protease CtpB [Calditrichota bacterium]